MRPEYPRPQLVREKWQNLNGEWDFLIDHGCSGKDRKFYENADYNMKINVPFAPESKLSGIEYVDFMKSVWYRRTFTVDSSAFDGRILIHFGAVDYRSEVWINGVSVGYHKGGYTPFVFDITDKCKTRGESSGFVFQYIINYRFFPYASSAAFFTSSRATFMSGARKDAVPTTNTLAP